MFRDRCMSDSRRTVFIAGGAGGLGPAVVRRLLPAYTCVVQYRSADSWARLQAELGQYEQLHGVQADLRDLAAVTRMVESVGRQWGPIYGLVNLVGGFAGGTVAETDHATWHQMIETHLTGAFTLINAVLPQMLQARAGRIIAIGTAATLTKPGGFTAYLVAKSALATLIEALAKEVKDSHITANMLLPESLDTPAMRAFMSRDKLVPLDRVAETIAFLLSDAAASITGALIPLTSRGDT
jgi:NAD(P)-dependent dehydrogenase (short-subunit alcohol dehydrogenase family)